MERDLNEREKAGVPDAVLLEDFTNDDVFIENLEKRFGENIIYVRRDVMARYRENRVKTYRDLFADLHRSSVDIDESVQGAADLLRGGCPGLSSEIFFRKSAACVSHPSPFKFDYITVYFPICYQPTLRLRSAHLSAKSLFYLPLEIERKTKQ